MAIYASKSTKGFYDDSIHASIPADAVEISAEFHMELLNGQSTGSTIDFDTVDGYPVLVVPAAPSLAQRQNGVWNSIKNKRDEITQKGGFKVGTKWFHSDTFSRSQHIGMVLMGENMPAGIQWKTMDGSFIEMTPTLATQVFAAAAAQDQAIFAAAESHRAAMELVDNPETYNFEAGWPETFQAVVE